MYVHKLKLNSIKNSTEVEIVQRFWLNKKKFIEKQNCWVLNGIKVQKYVFHCISLSFLCL